LLSSWLFRGVLAAVLLVVVAVGAWWFFIRSDEELATAPQQFRTPGATQESPSATPEEPETATPESSAENTPAAGGEPSEGFTTYTIVTDHPSVEGATEAAYFADEQFAGLSVPSTAKGATTDVSGVLHLGPDGLDPAAPSVITVNLTRLQSDEARRDNRVNGALQISQFPEAVFTAERIEGWPGEIPEGEDVNLQLIGTMDLKGVQRELTWDVVARRQGEVISALATTNFLYADFEIPLLNIAGFVSVDEDVTLQMQVIAVAS
jgi:polyisoprenoid-binding protein YceI